MRRRRHHSARLVLPLLFGLAAACFLFTLTAYSATPWNFTRTYIYKNWDNAEFRSQPIIDLNGGTIDLVIRGNVYDLCPNGSETLRITWRFDKDISRFNPNDLFGAKLEIRLAGVAGGCDGGLSARTQGVVTAGMSAGPNWRDIVGKRQDDDRFVNKSFNQMANGSKSGPNTVDTIIMVSGNEPYADRPAAGFIVYIGGPGGEIRILYGYEPVGAGGGNTNACGFTLGSGILNKWLQTGGEKGSLGCARSNENEAGRSPRGTSGRYALFNGGVIIWTRDGTNAGRSFEVHGCIASLYQQMGGTNSWLGFPISDEYSVPGGRRSDFEGGFIFWDAKTSRCQAYKYGTDTGGTNPDMPSIGGTWYREGDTRRPASISQNGNKLTFTNENGLSSNGHFESTDVVVAESWQGGLKGKLNADRTRIDWANGTSWSRVGAVTTYPNLFGTWYREGNRSLPAFVDQNGGVLVFTNEKGDKSAGHFESYYVVVADAWQGGLRGRLDQKLNLIRWDNGSTWQK